MTTKTLVDTLISGRRLTLELPTADDVIHWRFDQLEQAGYDELSALVVAIDPTVDLHQACALVESGCAPQLAVEILV